MDIILGIFCTVLTAIVLFNTVLLIGIAGSLAKMIRSNRGEEDNDHQQWSRMIRSRRVLHARQGNDASYADMAAMQAAPEPTRAWDGIPKSSKNWDGIPLPNE